MDGIIPGILISGYDDTYGCPTRGGCREMAKRVAQDRETNLGLFGVEDIVKRGQRPIAKGWLLYATRLGNTPRGR